MPSWSPDQYTLFEAERTRPARDLVAAVPLRSARRVVDLGCGPGNSTALLQARFGAAEVTGLDSSPAMLDKARAALPDVVFEHGDIADWTPQPDTDLVFANAVFHWLPDPVGHMRRIVSALPQNGVLAVQMPDNLNEPSHRAMAEIAGLAEFAASQGAGAARAALPAIGDYVARLDDLAQVDIWRTIYHHRLAGPDAIVDWFSGSGLRPFLDPLDAPAKDAFLAAYQQRIAHAYPALPDGSVILPFPRLFVVALKR